MSFYTAYVVITDWHQCSFRVPEALNKFMPHPDHKFMRAGGTFGGSSGRVAFDFHRMQRKRYLRTRRQHIYLFALNRTIYF